MSHHIPPYPTVSGIKTAGYPKDIRQRAEGGYVCPQPQPNERGKRRSQPYTLPESRRCYTHKI